VIGIDHPFDRIRPPAKELGYPVVDASSHSPGANPLSLFRGVLSAGKLLGWEQEREKPECIGA